MMSRNVEEGPKVCHSLYRIQTKIVRLMNILCATMRSIPKFVSTLLGRKKEILTRANDLM